MARSAILSCIPLCRDTTMTPNSASLASTDDDEGDLHDKLLFQAISMSLCTPLQATTRCADVS